MGQAPTAAPASDRTWWVIAASIAVLLVAAVAALVLRDDDSATITRAGTTSTTVPADQAVGSTSTSAPHADAATAAPDDTVPATTTTVPAPPSTAVAAAPARPPDHAAPLRDRTFESISVVEGTTERSFTDGASVRLQFEGTATGDVVRWRIDCNTGGGILAATADRLMVEETGSSAASCGEQRDADDTWLGSFFGSDPAWALDGSRLVLRRGDTVITLAEVPAERFGS